MFQGIEIMTWTITDYENHYEVKASSETAEVVIRLRNDSPFTIGYCPEYMDEVMIHDKGPPRDIGGIFRSPPDGDFKVGMEEGGVVSVESSNCWLKMKEGEINATKQEIRIIGDGLIIWLRKKERKKE